MTSRQEADEQTNECSPRRPTSRQRGARRRHSRCAGGPRGVVVVVVVVVGARRRERCRHRVALLRAARVLERVHCLFDLCWDIVVIARVVRGAHNLKVGRALRRTARSAAVVVFEVRVRGGEIGGGTAHDGGARRPRRHELLVDRARLAVRLERVQAGFDLGWHLIGEAVVVMRLHQRERLLAGGVRLALGRATRAVLQQLERRHNRRLRRAIDGEAEFFGDARARLLVLVVVVRSGNGRKEQHNCESNNSQHFSRAVCAADKAPPERERRRTRTGAKREQINGKRIE